MSNSRRLKRSNDRVIAGVCGGIAEFFGWEVTAVRALYVFLSVISAAFPGVLVYVSLWWIMPSAEDLDFDLDEFREQ
ncbi:MAG: PspC domain-containing protein [Gemmatimonadaceae bacterium]